MARSFGTCLPLPLNEEVLVDLIGKAKDWAMMHGAAMRPRNAVNSSALQIVPFSLLPAMFPRNEFNKAVCLQTILNELMHLVANDNDFLRETLANTIKVDDFTRRLYNIHERIISEGGPAQEMSLGLFRSDYMLHTHDSAIKQVEFNTVASSFGGISSRLQNMHSFILGELGHEDMVKNLPKNRALELLCYAMIEVWEKQGKPEAAIMFVVEDITYNICDQRFHEFFIRERRQDIKLIRKSLTQIHREARLGPNLELIVDGMEVSLVYFRSGYEPNQYPSENEWEARFLVEKSMAVKCPSINYHLAGTKKVQQTLAKKGVVEKFISDAEKVRRIREIFTGLYSMDANTEEGREALGKITMNTANLVMKPQREGGGNNVYGYDIPAAVQAMSPEERSAWILMDRIYPPTTKGYLVRATPSETPDEAPPVVDMVSELGIFGAVIGTKNEIIYNAQCGHMLRTKLEKTNEGGVAAGSGALDSPYLYD